MHVLKRFGQEARIEAQKHFLIERFVRYFNLGVIDNGNGLDVISDVAALLCGGDLRLDRQRQLRAICDFGCAGGSGVRISVDYIRNAGIAQRIIKPRQLHGGIFQLHARRQRDIALLLLGLFDVGEIVGVSFACLVGVRVGGGVRFDTRALYARDGVKPGRVVLGALVGGGIYVGGNVGYKVAAGDGDAALRARVRGYRAVDKAGLERLARLDGERGLAPIARHGMNTADNADVRKRQPPRVINRKRIGIARGDSAVFEDERGVGVDGISVFSLGHTVRHADRRGGSLALLHCKDERMVVEVERQLMLGRNLKPVNGNVIEELYLCGAGVFKHLKRVVKRYIELSADLRDGVIAQIQLIIKPSAKAL